MDEIPEGKQLVRIDVSVTPNEPVYEDIPKTEIQALQEGLSTARQDNTDVSEIVLDIGMRLQMLEGGM